MEHSALPVNVVAAAPVKAGAAAALVHLRVAQQVSEALGTLAVKAVLLVHARAPVTARAGGALINLHITHGP